MGFWNRLFGGGGGFRPFGKFQDGVTNFDLSLNEEAKVQLALGNPAFLKVCALQCEMFSMGKFYVYEKGKEIKDHPFLEFLEHPNPFQTQQQFLFEWMFWQMLGVSYVHNESDLYDRLKKPNMYLLKPYRVEYPTELAMKLDRMIYSEKAYRDIQNQYVEYWLEDGSYTPIRYGEIDIVADLGTPTSRVCFPSRLTALLKPLQNNEAAMDALNINVRYSGKFLVSGKQNTESSLPLTHEEKESIETKLDRSRKLHAVRSPIEIQRFVEDAGAQELPEAWLHTYFQIGTLYGIPRDVLEAFQSGTYENQEKARGAHVSYTIQPKGDTFASKLTARYIRDTKMKLVMSWDDQPFMQFLERDRAETLKMKAETVRIMQECGVTDESINEHIDLNLQYGRPQRTTDQGQ